MDQGDGGEEKEGQRIEKNAQNDHRAADYERGEGMPSLPPFGHDRIAPPTSDFRGSIAYPPVWPERRDAGVDAFRIVTL